MVSEVKQSGLQLRCKSPESCLEPTYYGHTQYSMLQLLFWYLMAGRMATKALFHRIGL